MFNVLIILTLVSVFVMALVAKLSTGGVLSVSRYVVVPALVVSSLPPLFLLYMILTGNPEWYAFVDKMVVIFL